MGDMVVNCFGGVEDGEVTIPVLVEFQDSDENMFDKQFDLSFKIYGPEELSKFGFKKSSYTLYIVLAIIIAVVGYFYWKRKKKIK